MQSGSKCLTPITHVKYKKIRRLEEFSTKNLINFFLLSTTLLYLCFQSMVLIAIWLLSSTYSNYKCYNYPWLLASERNLSVQQEQQVTHSFVFLCLISFTFSFPYINSFRILNPKKAKVFLYFNSDRMG